MNENNNLYFEFKVQRLNHVLFKANIASKGLNFTFPSANNAISKLTKYENLQNDVCAPDDGSSNVNNACRKFIFGDISMKFVQ